MAALRSRRLEGLFGARLDEVTHAQVMALQANAVSESYDLEFKRELYGGSDRAKKDLAGDVAALANTAGGVLLLGVAEDDQARAAGAEGVPLSDSEMLRIRSIVADLVHPLPTFDIRQVEDPAQPGHGFLLVAVPRSPASPHGVLVNEGLRYPRRHGASIVYLTEAEVAAAYQERFARRQSRYDDLRRYQGDLTSRLDTHEQTYVIVTLVPDLSGDFMLDTKTFNAFRETTLGKDLLVIPRNIYIQHVTVASRRLVAHGGPEPAKAKWIACELHQSGAGAFAAIVAHRSDTVRPGEVSQSTDSQVQDEDLVLDIWSALRFLVT
ncbi:ATP-binding protein [Streptomyces sp. NPDC023838]|uniref:AlbA family DNA-binding domain-containing protein n=1 Tax=Streptomyces sp. NPDC023838 TaxID=3154325 RepID=UPI0033F5090D